VSNTYDQYGCGSAKPGGPSVAVRASDITGAPPPVDGVDLDDDRLLVERFQRGDRVAFDELYRRHFTRLRSFCRRRVRDPHTAEEIAQETFARAFVALPRLRGERRFYPWLSVVAGRLCVDHHRRQGRLRPTTALVAGPRAGAAEVAVPTSDRHTNPWVCVAVDPPVDAGACVGSPFATIWAVMDLVL
jgi:hypothetical protein